MTMSTTTVISSKTQTIIKYYHKGITSDSDRNKKHLKVLSGNRNV